MRVSLWLGLAPAAGVFAAILADVCTTSYVQSVLPADNFIQGLVLMAGSVTANAVTNFTVPSSSSNPGKSGLNFCNVTLSYSHTGLNDEVGAVSRPNRLRIS